MRLLVGGAPRSDQHSFVLTLEYYSRVITHCVPGEEVFLRD